MTQTGELTDSLVIGRAPSRIGSMLTEQGEVQGLSLKMECQQE